MTQPTLDAFLNSHAQGAVEGEMAGKVVAVVRALATASMKVRQIINGGALGSALSAPRSRTNGGGDEQKALDVHADEIFIDAMRGSPVALYGSEELDRPAVLDPSAPLALAIDPLDGSSNIETNLSIGTIFGILPVAGDPMANPEATFRQPGSSQIAAGFFIYGPQLALALTLGSGTHVFVFSARLGAFVQANESLVVPERAHEFAINAANYRHWQEAVRLYIDDCLKGSEGPRERDFNMRWNASLVAEAYRILQRGGVFLYPSDARKGYGQGRLRLVYEANPIAMLVEQAGGGATDTVTRILDLVPESLHMRTPLVFGASREVARVARYHNEPSLIGERAPLFGTRGLFRV